MFNRQFSLLTIAILLLSPNLATANEIDRDTNNPNNPNNLSVGNVRIITTSNGTTIQTPKIQINAPKPPEQPRLISRTRRRSRSSVMGRIRTSTPPISTKKVSSYNQTTVTATTTSLPNHTIRSSSHNSQPVNEQQQSIRCSNSDDTIVSQSTSTITTINGRTISSEIHTNCN
jgi:hypothetical protein